MSSTLLAPNYEQISDELARAIRERRSDCQSHELTRLLHEYDQPGHTAILGIDHEATKAILYHEFDRYVVAIPIEPDGLAGAESGIARSDYWCRIGTRIGALKVAWGWLRPLFR